MPEYAAVLAGMATPAVLLLANAMLILSTINRLSIVLDRVRETELTIAGVDVAPEIRDPALLNELLLAHASRARSAHRALLSFYASAGMFIVTIVMLGVGGLGLEAGLIVALGTALVGSVLLLAGAALLVGETWVGIRATDQRFSMIQRVCQELMGKTGED